MKSLLIVLALGLIITFQNCSKVGFKVEHADNKVEAASESSPGNDNNDLPDPVSPADPAAPTDPSTPTTPPVSGGGGGVGNNVDSETAAALAECDRLKTANLQTIPRNSSIVNNQGSLSIKSERIETIQGGSGSMRILGIGESASIGYVTENRGSILICDMDVELFGSTQGSIRVVGGNVVKVTGDHIGSITVYNGNIGEISNNSGSINVRNGNIGTITNQRGSISIRSGRVTGAVTNHIGSLTLN